MAISLRPGLGGHHEHARQLRRPRVVDERRPDDLTEPVGEDAPRDLDPLLLGHAETGDLGTDGDPDDELGPTGGEAHLLVARRHGDRSRFERTDDVDDQTGGDEHRSVRVAGHLATGLDHEIGIRPGHLQLVPTQAKS